MAIAFVGSGTGYTNNSTTTPATDASPEKAAFIPSAASVGDTLFAFGSLRDVVIGDPTISGGNAAGTWTQVGSTTDDGLCRTKVWRRTIVPGDPGALVQMAWTTAGKGGLNIGRIGGLLGG